MSQRQPDRERSITEGFYERHLVEVMHHYEIENHVIREAKGARPRADYEPTAYPQLVNQFLKLTEGEEARVLAFAHKYGLPRYEEPNPDLEAAVLDDKLTLDDLAAHYSQVPLSWLWAHARGIRLCLDLLSLIERQDSRAIAESLGSIAVPIQKLTPSTGIPLHLPTAPIGWQRTTRSYLGFPANDFYLSRRQAPILFAAGVVSQIVTANLSGISLRLAYPALEIGPRASMEAQTKAVTQVSKGLHFAVSKTGDMIPVIYWHLARIAEGSLGLVRCQECGAYFAKTDGRQRFCPPESYAKKKGAESACQKRYYQRERRKEQ